MFIFFGVCKTVKKKNPNRKQMTDCFSSVFAEDEFVQQIVVAPLPPTSSPFVVEDMIHNDGSIILNMDPVPYTDTRQQRETRHDRASRTGTSKRKTLNSNNNNYDERQQQQGQQQQKKQQHSHSVDEKHLEGERQQHHVFARRKLRDDEIQHLLQQQPKDKLAHIVEVHQRYLSSRTPPSSSLLAGPHGHLLLSPGMPAVITPHELPSKTDENHNDMFKDDHVPGEEDLLKILSNDQTTEYYEQQLAEYHYHTQQKQQLQQQHNDADAKVATHAPTHQQQQQHDPLGTADMHFKDLMPPRYDNKKVKNTRN